MHDQRDSATAVVIDSGRPQRTSDIGDAAQNVAATSRVRRQVDGPGAAGALQDQGVVVIGCWVHVGPDCPGTVTRHRDSPEVGPVGTVGGGWQLRYGPFPVLVALDERLAASFRAVRFA